MNYSITDNNMKLLYICLLAASLMGLFLPIEATAETHDELLHFTAHAGAAYAVTLISDQVYNKFFEISPSRSAALGFATAIIAGSVYKLVETKDFQHIGDNSLYNAIGGVGAIGTILVFKLNLP